MARAINGEARGEPYEGQVSVGAVILNRVKDSRFPNSISGVIYQSGAFTAVSDGQINEPIKEDSTVYKAAQDAINGWDPTGGCVYYFNPTTATNKWIWSRPVVKQLESIDFVNKKNFEKLKERCKLMNKILKDWINRLKKGHMLSIIGIFIIIMHV